MGDNQLNFSLVAEGQNYSVCVLAAEFTPSISVAEIHSIDFLVAEIESPNSNIRGHYITKQRTIFVRQIPENYHRSICSV